MIDKVAYEDAREYQIAMEHDRRARNEAETVLALQEEAAEAVETFKRHSAGLFMRWALRALGL